jgi:Fe2+ or Zn2+ uptake regulation protein
MATTKELKDRLAEPLCELCDDDDCLLRKSHLYCDETNKIVEAQIKSLKDKLELKDIELNTHSLPLIESIEERSKRIMQRANDIHFGR